MPLKSIAQISADDDGRSLSYPYALFFDPVEEEIYLANGGTSRVVVYGPDFFPRVAIGIGRGVLTPRGGAVMSNGEVYICQPANIRNPLPRITILNGAFFIDREIFLNEIPEAAGFAPMNLAINRDGLIYLAGTSTRGVLVLDKEGNFLRLLQPTDTVRNPQAIEKPAPQFDSEEEQMEEGQQLPGENEEIVPEENISYADIPEEFRPRSSADDSTDRLRVGLGPVKINNVTNDSAGNLYLISPETSRIYVYGPDESFRFAFGQKGGSPRQLSQPRGLAIDEQRGLIYVVDYMRHTILTYNLAGEFLFEFGGRGFGPGWFNYPVSIAVNNHGQVIVADLFNKRIQVLEVGYEELLPAMKDEPPDETSPEETDTGEEEPQDEGIAEPTPAGETEESSTGEEVSGVPAAVDIEEISPDEDPSGPASESALDQDGSATEEILQEEIIGSPQEAEE